VGTGPSLNINVNGSKSYYVDEAFPAGLIDYTGETSNSIGAGAYFTANDIRGLFFDVINPVILTSVDVYPNSSGNRTIEVLDNQGNTVVDTTVFYCSKCRISYGAIKLYTLSRYRLFYKMPWFG
jgi:hypothetical protein